jgi:hypothetical protein
VIVLITGLVIGLRETLPEEAPPTATEVPARTGTTQQPISADEQTISPDRTVPSTTTVSRPPAPDDPGTPQAPATSAPEQASDSPDDSPDRSDDSSSVSGDEPDPTIDAPSPTPPPTPPTTTAPPKPQVDAEVKADETVISSRTKLVEIEVSGLAEEGGVLTITTTDDDRVFIMGDCPERECHVEPGTTVLDFAVRSKGADESTTVSFTVTPEGDVEDPDLLNNTVEVEVAS